MNRGFAGVCLLVGLAVLGMAAFAAVAGTAGAADNAPENGDNASLGAEISSFMQASSAEAAGDVEDGRFEAAMNRTDNATEREALIEARQARLEARNDRLAEQRGAIGNSPDVRNRSLATRIAVDARGIERAANSTEPLAAEVGADTERIAKIRSDARTIRGPGIAELARGIAGPPGETPSIDGDGPGAPGPDPPTDNGTDSDAREAQRGPPADAAGSDETGAATPESSSEDDPTGPDASNGSSDGGPPDGTGPPDSDDSPSSADDTSGDGEQSDAADTPGERGGSEPGDRNADTADDDSTPTDDAGPPDHAGGPS